MGFVIKIILGLFVWLMLPSLVLKSRSKKPLKKFVKITCMIVGLIIVFYGVLGFLTGILNLEL